MPTHASSQKPAESSEESLDSQQRMGEELLKKGRFNEACRTFDRIKRKDPNYVKAELGTAEALVGLAERHQLRAVQLQAAYMEGKTPENVLKKIIKLKDDVMGEQAAAMMSYKMVMIKLSESRDTSKIENPEEVINECERKKRLIVETISK